MCAVYWMELNSYTYVHVALLSCFPSIYCVCNIKKINHSNPCLHFKSVFEASIVSKKRIYVRGTYWCEEPGGCEQLSRGRGALKTALGLLLPTEKKGRTEFKIMHSDFNSPTIMPGSHALNTWQHCSSLVYLQFSLKIDTKSVVLFSWRY